MKKKYLNNMIVRWWIYNNMYKTKVTKFHSNDFTISWYTIYTDANVMAQQTATKTKNQTKVRS